MLPMRMAKETGSEILLPIASCYFLDFPDNQLDCVTHNESQFSPSTFCYRCRYLGKFISAQEKLDDFDGPGHIFCLVVLGVIIVLGTLATLANLLIIYVLKRRKSGKAFDTFLTTLACYDAVCSVFSIVISAGSVIYFQNWDRGRLPLYLYYIGTFTTLFGRSGSSYMTVLISFERYVAVAYPLRTLGWFGHRRTRILAFCSLLFSLVMALPRFTSCYVGRNSELGKLIGGTRDLDYLLMSTPLETFFYVTFKGYFNQVDFWAPFPLLFVINGLIYYQLWRYNETSEILDQSQKSDIRAVRMFIPVVLVLFFCNLTPIVINFFLVLQGIYYRELAMGVALSYVLNSAANLPIYYFGGAAFRKETKEILNSSFPKCRFSLKFNRRKTIVINPIT